MSAEEPFEQADDPKVEVGMGIRAPRNEVFEAFVDPAVTTRFWFTKSSGIVEPGADLTWSWEMYGVSARVMVVEVVPDERIEFDWGSESGPFQRVMVTLDRWGTDRTYVKVTERGFGRDRAEALAAIADSTGGFSLVLAALKAYLEHGVVLRVVLDHHPPNLDQEADG